MNPNLIEKARPNGSNNETSERRAPAGIELSEEKRGKIKSFLAEFASDDKSWPLLQRHFWELGTRPTPTIDIILSLAGED